jgi:ankyrin repeat protein
VHYAIQEGGHNEVVRLLLDNGAFVNPIFTEYGDATPIFLAAGFGHSQTVALLLEYGAPVNLPSPDGITPLFLAASHGHIAMVQLLLENGAAVNTSIPDGSTPLFAAAKGGHGRVVAMLLEHGAAAAVHHPTVEHGSFAAMRVASLHGHLAVVQLLAMFGATTTAVVAAATATPAATATATAAAATADTEVGASTPREGATERCRTTVAKWLAAVEAWSPLQMAAGCRFRTATTTAVKLGLVDPEQGGVGAMLAARSTAASTAPWGEMDPAQEALEVLAHVPHCPLTTRLVFAATSGWSATNHWLHHANVRAAVHTVLLASERLRQQATSSEHEVLPHMPSEMWLLFMRFLRRSDWKVAVPPPPSAPSGALTPA